MFAKNLKKKEQHGENLHFLGFYDERKTNQSFLFFHFGAAISGTDGEEEGKEEVTKKREKV